MFIPVIIQNARFRVLEQFQFEARQLNQGYSLFLWRNNKMILRKRFFDGAKNDLYVVIDFEKDATWMVLLENAGAYSPEQPFTTINALSKLFFSPTETCILNGHGYIMTPIHTVSIPAISVNYTGVPE